MVLKELIFNNLYFWEGVVVLKELIYNSFYFWRVWWSTIYNLGGCGGLERTDF